MSKIRIRTKKELEERKLIFFNIIKVLKKKKIFHFLQGGIQLGACREKNFIKWDWDVEISVYAKDLINNFDELLIELKKNKFKISSYNLTHFTPKISFYRPGHKATSFSIIGWKYNIFFRSYNRAKLRIPIKFMKKMSKIKFFNKFFYAPKPVEEYLEYQYGEWKIPIRSAVKEIYLTNKFYKKNENILDIYNKIINLIFKIKK